MTEAYKAEVLCLKQELDRTQRLLNETREELEDHKMAYSKMKDEMLRYEGKIAAFEFMIKNGR